MGPASTHSGKTREEAIAAADIFILKPHSVVVDVVTNDLRAEASAKIGGTLAKPLVTPYLTLPALPEAVRDACVDKAAAVTLAPGGQRTLTPGCYGDVDASGGRAPVSEAGRLSLPQLGPARPRVGHRHDRQGGRVPARRVAQRAGRGRGLGRVRREVDGDLHRRADDRRPRGRACWSRSSTRPRPSGWCSGRARCSRARGRAPRPSSRTRRSADRRPSFRRRRLRSAVRRRRPSFFDADACGHADRRPTPTQAPTRRRPMRRRRPRRRLRLRRRRRPRRRRPTPTKAPDPTRRRRR